MNSLFSKINEIKTVYGAVNERNTCVSSFLIFLRLIFDLFRPSTIRKWVFIETAQCFSQNLLSYMFRLSYERSIFNCYLDFVESKRTKSKQTLIIEFAQSWPISIRTFVLFVHTESALIQRHCQNNNIKRNIALELIKVILERGTI